MKTTVEALKDFYVSRGGKLTDVVNNNTIPDMIEALNALEWGGGGSEQSTPITSDDVDEIVNSIS